MRPKRGLHVGQAQPRLRRFGTQERFWAKVDRGGPVMRPELSACWLWRASRTSDGYGLFRLNGKPVKANRAAWTLSNGVIPAGLCVLHRCDNPPCVNPSHLFLGTQAENVADRKAKGRSARMAGESNGQSKLTELDVKDVICLVLTGAIKAEVARRFGVARSTVGKVLAGQKWSFIAGADGPWGR